MISIFKSTPSEESRSWLYLSSKLHQFLSNEFTMFPFNFITFCAAIFLLYFIYKKRINDDQKSKNNNLPPSPPRLPIIGNLHQIGKDLHRSLHGLSTKYGPLMILHLGSFPVLVVSSAEIVDEIIKQQDVIFSDRPNKRSSEIFYSGNIVFSRYNNYLRFTKKISVSQLLSSRKVQAFQFIREQETGRILEKIKLACRNEDVVNLSEIFVSISSSTIARSAFGRVLNCSCESVAKLVKKAICIIFGFWVGDLFPYLGWMDFLMGNTRCLNNIRNELHTFLDRVIEDHRGLKPDEQKYEEKDFVDILLDVSQDATADIRLTEENIKAILMDMFVGGTETAASIMEWAMAELMKNPSKMKKAQEEVRRVVGKNSKVNENNIVEMKYLKLIIKETLRLYSPVIPRETTKSVVLKGYDIPSKIYVIFNVWAVQRDPKSWDKPEEFYPERFEDMDIDLRGSQGHFIPFGFGRRTCPGVTQANAVMEYTLANLLYWFDWKLPSGSSLQDFDMNDFFQTVIHKREPLLLVPIPWSP